MSEKIQAITNQILVFTLDNLSYGIPIYAVIKVYHAVEVWPLPKAPKIVTGIINVKGQVIPVIDIRKILALTQCKMELYNRLVLVNTGKRIVALLVDSVNGILNLDINQQLDSHKQLLYGEFVSGALKVDGGFIYIYNLDRFLCIDEEYEIEQALKYETYET